MNAIGSGKWHSVLFLSSVIIPFFRIITAECPPEILIKPCSCRDFPITLVECGGITDMQTLVSVFERTADRKFSSFALRNSSLQYLPASSITAKRFEEILLVNVTMTAMFDQSPDTSNNISRITILESKFLRGIGWENWGNLKKLQTILIHGTEVKSLGKSFVDNMSATVQRFHLIGSRVRKMQYNAFSEMTGLYDLKVLNSEIKSLRRSLFMTPTIMSSLNFADNQIDTLPDDLFTEMPSLQYINLSGNLITTITEAVFGDVYDRIYQLRMDNNPVVCDCSLQWYMSRNRRTLKGNCAGPEDRKGKSFDSLTRRDFSYCT
ncbi:hypothetical protein AVEN_131902-1 [Araneus ventricosus]|uniref:LRRCT domain-containing protein n=1 Tax=Araneus ventricosus TaxID=182803 RepID=A0A4Y2LBT9_ARAVE|nr:hypothetical protein AVEN_131902-1 [Araneus ventricosus]